MNGLLFPPPYPPGFQPPQISLKFFLLSMLFMVVVVFAALCLAALQAERKQKKEAREAGHSRLTES